MKKISTFIAFTFWTILAYSQTINSEDTTVIFTSDQINISCSSSKLFSKISIATNKFQSGRQGINISLTTKPKQETPNIRIDSIIFTSVGDKILTLSNPYRDTVYYIKDGGLFLSAIHWVDKAQIEMLQKQTITAIVLTVDEKPITIKISKKSQRELKDAADRNFSMP